MLTKSDICCIMVTYNSNNYILENIKLLEEQVDHILIMNNGSNNNSKNLLKKFKNKKNINVLFKEKNIGLSKALQEGYEYAKKKKYKLLLTMDQDSKFDIRFSR